MKATITVFSILLATLTSWAQPLLIDFNNLTTPTQSGFQAYNAVNAVAASASNQTYSAFGTTIGIDLDWDRPENAGTMRVVDRPVANAPEAPDLLRDWIGTDNRAAASPGGINPNTLTVTGLPAGTYRWLSYHHDPNDQTGLFTAVVLDAFGSRTNTDIDISNGALPLASVTKWTANLNSDGINPIRLRFAGQATTPVSASFFLINGFELSFLGFVSVWTNTTGGNWSDAANWDATGVPNGVTDAAMLGSSILTPSTVTVNIPVTLGTLILGSAQGYTLSGPNAITLDGPSGISAESGSHTIAVPIAVTSGGGLALAGAGALTLSGANTYTGPTVASLPSLTIPSLPNGGSPSPLGASSSDAANLVWGGTLRYVGPGESSDRLFTLPAGTRTLDASGTGALILNNPGDLNVSGTGARTLVLTGTNTGNNTLSAVVANDASFNRTAITKNGSGRWVLAGANTSSGNITVNAGTLALSVGASLGFPALITVQSNAVLDVSAAGGLQVAFGPLQGSGSVVGNVTDGSAAIVPGGTNVAGTLTFSNALTMNAGGTIVMDLSSSTTVGGGVNDLIEVGGDLDLSAVNLLVNFTGASLTGPYRLINYGGALLGTPSVTVQGLDITRYTATVSTATPGQVNLVISGAPASLTWLGDGSANFWDVKTSQNWSNAATTSLDMFSELDHVIFNNAGGANANVNLIVPVRPGSVTVDATADYSFVNTGQMSGAMNLTKANTGTLTISNANNYTGTTTISGGILRLGNNTALGTSAGGTVIQSGGTLDVYGFQTSADHISVAGTGVGGVGAIINTRAEQQSAIRMLTLTGDTLVSSDFRWDVRGLGGAASFSGLFDLAGFTLTKAGTNRVVIVDAMATNAGNIVVREGGLGMARSRIEGPGYIDVGTNFFWIEATATGAVTKPLIFANGRLQYTGGGFLLDSFITNVSGLTLDMGGVLTLSNTISGAGSLTKIGASIARLEAANTYAGDTTISAGTLALGTNGTLGGGPLITIQSNAVFDVSSQGSFTVASGRTLTAAGTVNGTLTVANGATLQVGSPTNTGTLTVVNGNVTLSGDTLMKLDATTKTNDLVSTTNTINFGGTLTVSVLTGTPAVGEIYKLFNAPVINNSFSSVTLPALGQGQIWINNLAVNGTLEVGDQSAPVLTVTQVSGGSLQFTWPTAFDGLVKLQAQTNTLAIGISTNWGDYPGGTINGVLHAPSLDNPTVFFRLAPQ